MLTNRRPERTKNSGPARQIGAALICATLLASCGGTVVKHGHVFAEDDLAQVKPGMTKDQVSLALGTPDTTSTAGNDVYYYISTTTNRPMAFMKAKVTDRQVVAIYFDQRGSVNRVANYGLQDGKVVDFVTRKTPSYAGEDGLLKSLFRNIGSGVNPGLKQE